MSVVNPWAICSDEETFYRAKAPTREAALQEARERWPDASTLWTARLVEIDYARIVDVDSIHEDMQAALDDICGEASEDWEIPTDVQTRLASLIADFLLKEVGPIECFGIDDVEQHNVVASA